VTPLPRSYAGDGTSIDRPWSPPYAFPMSSPLSGNDAAILALLARAPKLREGKASPKLASVDQLLQSLTTEEARSIGKALVGRMSPDERAQNQNVDGAATELEAWASGLRPARTIEVTPLPALDPGIGARPRAAAAPRSRKARG
jgi:hypothetical protein